MCAKKGAHTTEVGSCKYYTRLKMLANNKRSSLMCAKEGTHTTQVGSRKYYTRPKMLADDKCSSLFCRSAGYKKNGFCNLRLG